MIKDLDQTIKAIILQKAGLSLTEIEIVFDQPTGNWANALTRPTIDCYLYDIRENLELRNIEWHTTGQSGRGIRTMDPMRVDLAYMVTAWTTAVQDEHEILWRTLAALANTSPIPPDLCHGSLKNQIIEIPTRTAQITEAISNLSDLWNVMENQLKPAINYVVTLSLDRNLSITEPLVVTKRMQMKRIGLRASGSTSTVSDESDELVQIAGVVFRKKTNAPVKDAEVLVLGSGLKAVTDMFGRYSIRQLSSGSHKLRITTADRSTEVQITVPSESTQAFDVAV